MSEVVAQVIVPGVNAPPIPPRRPSPQIQVPAIPQLGAVQPPNYLPLPQNSFSDRVLQCNQVGAAGGLIGADLDAYVRLCVNQ